MYKNLDDLAKAFQSVDLTNENSFYDVVQLNTLLSVYFDALYDPPEGVIGVGAITYAEYKLMEAQGGVV